MADNVNSVDYQLQVARQYGAPLDKTEVFTTYEDAVAYARGGIAYAGQLISVVNGEAVNIYKIMNDRTLVAMDAKSITMSNELPKPNGVARAGTSGDPARGDHVHKMPTAEDVGALSIAGGDLTGDLTIYNTSKKRIIFRSSKSTAAYNLLSFDVGGNGYLCVHSESVDSGLKTITEINFPKESGTVALNGSVWRSVYPVGAIYISTNAGSPANLFGGSWEQLMGGLYLRTMQNDGCNLFDGSHKEPGDAGTIVDEGLPNIFGTLKGVNFLGAEYSDPRGSLAFTVSAQEHLYRASGTSKDNDSSRTVTFDAKKGSQTTLGESSRVYGYYGDIYGTGTRTSNEGGTRVNHVIPQSYKVYMWRRKA